MTQYTITDDEFAQRFPLIKNHLDGNAAFEGCMFETYGPELEFVRKQDPNCIWTLLEDDYGRLGIGSGYHYVNRLGYFVSTVPFADDDDYWVDFEEETGDDDVEDAA